MSAAVRLIHNPFRPQGMIHKSTHRRPLLLVVDDDAVDRRRVRRMLADQFDVVEATSGSDALATINSREPDCVLLDFDVPGTNTLALMGVFLDRLVPVVLYTGHGNESVAGAAMQAGADGYVIKGNGDAKKLRVVLQSAIQRSATRRSVATLAWMIESSSDAIIGMTPDGVITSWNRGAATLYGYADEVLGSSLDILVPPDRLAEVSEILHKVGRGELIKQLETVHVCRDGTQLDVSLNASPIRNPRGQIIGASVIARDVTARNRYEEGLREAKRAAEQANNAKSAFFANVTHELRTPLQSILGMTELCLKSDPTEQQQHYLSIVHSNSKRLAALLNDILDFSKIEAGKLEIEPIEFNLRDSLAETLSQFTARAQEKQVGLDLQVHPDVPDRLVGDLLRVGQIVSNLLSNGIKFSERGMVVVDVQVESCNDNQVQLHFRVIDAGIGIAGEKLRSIFAPFEQADTSTARKYGGTGLGLAISSQLVQLMKGRIWAESELGKGSTFHFVLPLLVPAPISKQALSSIGHGV